MFQWVRFARELSGEFAPDAGREVSPGDEPSSSFQPEPSEEQDLEGRLEERSAHLLAEMRMNSPMKRQT